MPDYSNEASAQLYAAGTLWYQVEAKACIYETFHVHFHTVCCKTVLRAEGKLKLELREVWLLLEYPEKDRAKAHEQDQEELRIIKRTSYIVKGIRSSLFCSGRSRRSLLRENSVFCWAVVHSCCLNPAAFHNKENNSSQTKITDYICI